MISKNITNPSEAEFYDEVIQQALDTKSCPIFWGIHLVHEIPMFHISYATHGAGIFTNIYPINHPVL